MEIYNKSGVLKSGTLRVTQSIGALGFTMGQPLENMTNEVITIYIERSKGENEYICDKTPLAAVLMTSAFGEGEVIEVEGFCSCLIELSEDGAINLEDNERIVIILDNLKSVVNYEIHGIQYPTLTNNIVSFERKIMLANELKRSFKIEEVDECAIIGTFEKLVLTYDTEQGRQVVEHTLKELKYIQQDFGGYVQGLVHIDGSMFLWMFTCLSLVGVEKMEIHAENEVQIILRSV